MNKIKTLPPFKRFCMTIGQLPTSYLESMSYAECVVWLCNYLKETVVPAVNENAEAVNELIEWFDNLDVQEEVNNKLDEMVEDGTLASIINQEVFGELNDRIEEVNTTLTNEIEELGADNTIIMGDSYARGTDGDNQETLTSWAEIVKDYIEAENSNNVVHIIAEAGAGFMRAGTENHTFLQLLQSEINNIPNKNLIKNIIICGGYNDNTYSSTNIKNAVIAFVNYCATQFPNAIVYVGCIGYRNEISSDAALVRSNIAHTVYPSYANNVSSVLLNKSYVYLSGVENILKTIPKSYMFTDNAHPNQNGQNSLGQGIYQAFRGGKFENYYSASVSLTNANASTLTSTNVLKRCGNTMMISITNIQETFTQESATAWAAGSRFTIGNYSVNGFIGGCNKDYNIAQCQISIQDYSKGRYSGSGYLMFDVDGTLKLYTWQTETGSSVAFSNVKQINVYNCTMILPTLES